MTVQLKTAEDLAKMRVAGKLAAEVLEMIAPHVVPGVTRVNSTASAINTSSTCRMPSPLRLITTASRNQSAHR
jgi:methionyl aminopeptidase